MTNNLQGSFVMEEFIKVAKDMGLITTNFDTNVLGNPDKDTPVKTRNEPEKGKYDVTKDDDIVGKAHPKEMQTAKSQGKGGVVENIKEQQEKDIEVATKMPTGALIGVHAEVICELVKLANHYDAIGNTKVADRIDSVIKKLNHPFDNGRLHKEAYWQIILGLLGTVVPLAIDYFSNKGPAKTETVVQHQEQYDKEGKLVSRKPVSVTRSKPTGKGLKGVAGVAAAIGLWPILQEYAAEISNLKEGIKTDSQDLIDMLNEASEDAPSAGKALALLQPFNNKIQSLNLSDDKQFNEFIIVTRKMQKDLPLIKQYITRATKIEDPTILPFGDAKRLEASLSTFEQSLTELEGVFANASDVGDKIEEEVKKQMDKPEEEVPMIQDVAGVQELISRRGFAGRTWNVPVTGEMDEETLSALKEIENEINQNKNVQQYAKNKGLQGKLSIMDGNKIKGNAEQLEKMFEFVEDKFI